jgi:hypothetical protein
VGECALADRKYKAIFCKFGGIILVFSDNAKLKFSQFELFHDVYLLNDNLGAVLVIRTKHIAAKDDIWLLYPEDFTSNFFGTRNGFKLKFEELNVEGFVRHVFLDILYKLFGEFSLRDNCPELLQLGILSVAQMHEFSSRHDKLLLKGRSLYEPLT